MDSSTAWSVITAGPSAGKSTTINAISYLGYDPTVVPVKRLGERVNDIVGEYPDLHSPVLDLEQ